VHNQLFLKRKRAMAGKCRPPDIPLVWGTLNPDDEMNGLQAKDDNDAEQALSVVI
jgi:hypothetical protein